jgi:hypothetical protein
MYFSHMDILNEFQEERKGRHGCVTAWLIFMIVTNSFVVISYLFLRTLIQKNSPDSVPSWAFITLGVMGIANIIFAAALLRWKKWGFFGFVLTTLIAAGINLKVGTTVLQTLLGLAGVFVLYGILRITKDGVSTWDQLE